jgi:hypothetical protein
MASVFAGLESLVSEEIDALYGEPTRIDPKAKTSKYLAGSADNTRASQTVTGIVDFDPVTLISQDVGKYDGARPAIAGEKIHISYDLGTLQWVPKTGDVIVLIDREDEPLLISRTDPDGLGRVVCVCQRGPEAVTP